MTRLIDADEIPYREIWKEEWLKNAGKFQQGVFKDEIDEMPTVDAVPVIRCKDCKWYYRGGATCMYWDGANAMFGDDFCSRAERKDNGADKRRR